MDKKGKFIVFEGLDASGKSTILNMVKDWLLENTDMNIMSGSEPTQQESGLFIRKALRGDLGSVSTEMVLGMFLADRAQHQQEIVNRNSDTWYLCDRYSYSNVAYNSSSEEDSIRVEQLNQTFIKPDITLYIDTPIDTCLARISSRNQIKEIYENRKKLESAKKIYDRLTAEGKMIHIDGSQPVNKILDDIIDLIYQKTGA